MPREGSFFVNNSPYAKVLYNLSVFSRQPRPDVKRQGYYYEAAFGGSTCEAGFVTVARGFIPVRGRARRYAMSLRKTSK
jgi:hypothetical protein